MLSPDEMTHATDTLEEIARTTDTLEELTHTTGELERVPRIFDRNSTSHTRKPIILPQKQTDVLPPISNETTGSRSAWRQVIYLREENKQLRAELDEQRAELQRQIDSYLALRTEFDKEVDIIHNGYQQEIEQYQIHLRELMDERNLLHKSIQEAEHSSQPSELQIQDFRQTVQLQVRQEEEKHLVEALYLKREMQHLVETLEQERSQVEQERQHLLLLQKSSHEQAELRQKMLHIRMHARWRLRTAMTSIAALGTLLAAQWIFLLLFHVPVSSILSLALIGPVVVGLLCAVLGASPYTMIKHVYEGAPHKKRVKNSV